MSCPSIRQVYRLRYQLAKTISKYLWIAQAITAVLVVSTYVSSSANSTNSICDVNNLPKVSDHIHTQKQSVPWLICSSVVIIYTQLQSRNTIIREYCQYRHHLLFQSIIYFDQVTKFRIKHSVSVFYNSVDESQLDVRSLERYTHFPGCI